jgi:hypothetical protein
MQTIIKRLKSIEQICLDVRKSSTLTQELYTKLEYVQNELLDVRSSLLDAELARVLLNEALNGQETLTLNAKGEQ